MSERSALRAAGEGAVQHLFWPALVLSAALLGVFQMLDQPLRTPAAANGIVSYELAGTAAAAQAIIDSWDARARGLALFGLGLDYLFMPSYALAIGLGCVRARRGLAARWSWLALPGLALAWGQGAAALLDATENYSLARMLLDGAAAAPWPSLAAGCAAVKFVLIAMGLAYALAGAAIWLGGRLALR